MAYWAKDPTLSLQWLRSLLWHRFDSWLRNFHMLQAWQKKKKKKKKKKKNLRDTAKIVISRKLEALNT